MPLECIWLLKTIKRKVNLVVTSSKLVIRIDKYFIGCTYMWCNMNSNNKNIKDVSLQLDTICDNFSLEELSEIYKMKQILSKYNFPQVPSSDGYYHIYVKDTSKKTGRKAVKDKTLDGLKAKVLAYEHETMAQAKKTFKKVYELSQERKLSLVKSAEKRISMENTITRTNSDYKRFIDGTSFEKKNISDITLNDIENVIEYNLTRYDLHKKALDNMRAILNTVFKYALHEYWVNENPCSRIDFRIYGNMLVESTNVKYRVHSDSELNAILDELHMKQLKNPKLSSAWALELQILMGARRGELPPLRWSDITTQGIEITQEQLTHGNEFIIVSHTKTNRDRLFPLTKDIENFLMRLKSMHEKYYPNSMYLFPANTQNGVITNRAVYSVYRKICQKLNIAIQEDVIRGPHSFRRNAITSVVNSPNGNMELASSLFGNSPKVAKSNYFTGIDMNNAIEVLNYRTLIATGNH